MPDLPFSIPESLASYVIQYESSPAKTIHRLKEQLKKRGPDPIGYFLLGWFYHRQGAKEEAIEYALKAKNFAPGSPFITKVHYFFTHPHLFDAWQTYSEATTRRKDGYQTYSGPILDLDTLIQKLSSMESPKKENMDISPSSSGSALSRNSDDVDDIVSETLAEIHEQQGKTDAAIKIYKKLLRCRQENRDYYKEQIARLKRINEEGEA